MIGEHLGHGLAAARCTADLERETSLTGSQVRAAIALEQLQGVAILKAGGRYYLADGEAERRHFFQLMKRRGLEHSAALLGARWRREQGRP